LAKKSKAVVVEDEVDETETDDLEDLEDLEDLADADEDVEDEDEDDEEEAPRKKKKGKAKKAKAKKESDTVGSAELAEALGTDGKNLRVMLRDKKVAKNANGRYEWEDLDTALEELGFDDLEDAQQALKEARDKRLEKLKDEGAKKRAAKKAASDDEDDEDEDDEDEDEAPAPKAKKKKKAKR
jgi:sRNA-binding protein